MITDFSQPHVTGQQIMQGIAPISQGLDRRAEEQKGLKQQAIMGEYMDAAQAKDYGKLAIMERANPVLMKQFGEIHSSRDKRTNSLLQTGFQRALASNQTGAEMLDGGLGAQLAAMGEGEIANQIAQLDADQLEQRGLMLLAGTPGGAEIIKMRMGGGIDPDFLKEERKQATQSVNALKKRSSVINSSYNKIGSLVPKIKDAKASMNSRRIASGAAVQSLARIVSPGIVTKEDQVTMSGAADPLAAAIAAIQSKDPNLAADLQRAIDPLNPNLIDADGLLSIAESLIASEAPSILQEYGETESRSSRSGMNERQLNTIFGDSGSITGLDRFVVKKAPDGTDVKVATGGGVLPEGTVDNGDGTLTLPTGERIKKKKGAN